MSGRNLSKENLDRVLCFTGSSSSSDVSALTKPLQCPEATALTYLLQTYSRVNNEEKIHPKVSVYVYHM